ncbi:MAG: hypothetical protein V4532_05800 [Pseudomonadota bacterium]
MLSIFRINTLGICAAAWMLCIATSAHAQEAHHQHDGLAATPALQRGEKWPTDAVLRQSMDNIRQAMMASQEDIDQARLKDQDYLRLAEIIDKNTADIVKNCHLSKEADAAFHSMVLSTLRQDAELMRIAPKTQVKRVAAMGVLQSLRHYGDYFQHPGWSIAPAKTH